MAFNDSAIKRAQSSSKLVLFSIIVSIILAIIKILTGVLGNSYAMIADGAESLMDVLSSGVVLGGLKFATLPPTKNHPYGFGKAEPLAGVAVSLTLMAVGVAIAIQSTREILTPHHAPSLFTLPILVLIVITKEVMFRKLSKKGGELSSTALKADGWHQRSDALTSIAAFVGISISLIFGEGFESADDYAALLATVVIFITGSKLFKESIVDVLDIAAPTELEEQVRSMVLDVEGVEDVEKCIMRKSGLGYFVDMHLWVAGDLSVREGHAISHRVKDKLFAAKEPAIIDVLIHIEPYPPQI